jgi:type 1 fimbria pilin
MMKTLKNKKIKPMNRVIKMILIVAIASIAGCYYDSEERLYPKLSSPCNDVTVTFSGTVSTILQPCQSCHSNSNASSSGSGIKLQDYKDVMIVVSNGKLMGSIRHDNSFIPMPQTGGSLPQCEIDQLQKWIDNQTPNN